MNFHIFCSYGSLYFISQFYHTYASFDIYRLLFAGQYSARQLNEVFKRSRLTASDTMYR